MHLQPYDQQISQLHSEINILCTAMSQSFLFCRENSVIKMALSNNSMILGILIFCTAIVSTIGLRCRECFDAHDIRYCKYNSTCKQDELCGIHKIQYDGETKYRLGCTLKEVCSGSKTLPPLVGRRKKRAVTTLWLHCCDTDLCNVNPEHLSSGSPSQINPTPSSLINTMYVSSHERTSVPVMQTSTVFESSIPPMTTSSISTSGHVTNQCSDIVDCPILLKHLDICNNLETATKVCPLSCGFCCEDFQTCPYLLNRYGASVCTNPFTARNECPKTCGYCGSVCRDKTSDCPYLEKTLNICKDSDVVRKFGCEATCGVCKFKDLFSSRDFANYFTQPPQTQYNYASVMPSMMSGYRDISSQYIDQSATRYYAYSQQVTASSP